MFQGIILGLGTVTDVQDRPQFRRLSVDLAGLVAHVEKGGSVAVNGTCLTSVACAGFVHSFDVMEETLQKTNLGLLKKGDKVNIEFPLKWGAEISGHLVQGHVDTVATIVERKQDQDNCRIWFSVPPQFVGQMIPKGSVAIDGISLTLVDVDKKADKISVALIPYALSVTTLGFKQIGDKVNIELDHSAKMLSSSFGPVIESLGADIASMKVDIEKLKKRCL
ncbi:MAG: riboflavin synthase [Candidatus Aenigmarchaeota archaeon]|nr:riboflavin synthase [Candidatus Aenigmarchaeota archaeon]